MLIVLLAIILEAFAIDAHLKMITVQQALPKKAKCAALLFTVSDH